MLSGQFILLGILLMMSAFFSATETAFTSLSVMQIQEIKKRHPRRGRLVERLHSKPDTVLATVLIGNNLANITISVVSTNLTIQLFSNTALGIATGVITLVILVFCEIMPKQLAILNNERITQFTAPITYALSMLFFPVIWVLNLLSRMIIRLSPKNPRSGLNLDGILHMVKHAETIGILENYRTRMVKSIFRFNDVSVHTVMTHRTKVFSLPQSMPLDEALRAITDAGFSRVPVYHKDPEHIVGIALEKDVIRALYEPEQSREKTLKDVIIDPIVIPESWKIHKAFAKLKSERLNLAVVLDEYGGLAGVVTMEDLVEEIIGELYDEHEEIKTKKVVRHESGTYTIQGDTPIYVLEDVLGVEFDPDRTTETVGGYLAEVAESFPATGDTIDTELGTFVVDRISRKQILSVKFRPLEAAEQKAKA